jgi:carboxypeptidase Taq
MDAYKRLIQEYRPCIMLASAQMALQWDLDVMMPEKASAARAEIIAFLEKESHRRLNSQAMWRALGEASDWADKRGADPAVLADIQEIRRQVDRASRLPESLVTELAEHSAVSQKVWEDAHKKNDFSLFLPNLTRMFELKRQEADALGYADSPYDALMDEFEPGFTTTEAARLLGSLENKLAPLVQRIVRSRVKIQPLQLAAKRAAQEQLCRTIAAQIGFDFQAGRLDSATHPSTERYQPFDTRITTRYDEADLFGSVYSTIHEVGHGLYEQGLAQQDFYLARGIYCSLGLHESQSRLWENIVGRSRGFCRYLLGEINRVGVHTYGLGPEDLYQAYNRVSPSLIRTEADEVTYNLHICLRFKLERQLVEGALDPRDLPCAWKGGMAQLLGIDVPTDTDGVLQDVHWSCGLIGYFPTYTLGNLHSAQLFAAAEAELGSQEANFEAGNFQPLRDWMQRNVISKGRTLTAAQIVKLASGQTPSADHFMKYLHSKFDELYRL